MKPHEAIIAQWKRNGELLGYPHCCIEHFLAKAPEAKKSGIPIYGYDMREKREPWNGTGYIPCPVCREQYNADPEGFVAKQIAPRRRYEIPFPKG